MTLEELNEIVITDEVYKRESLILLVQIRTNLYFLNNKLHEVNENLECKK